MYEFEVSIWSGNPANGGDDCLTSAEFNTIEAARRFFDSPNEDDATPFMARSAREFGVWLVLSGDDVYEVRRVSGKASRDNDDDWRQEMQTQAGMAFGVDGWNDWAGR